MKLALSEITADQHAQPRAMMDVEVVDEYGKDMKRGDRFPPVVVFFDGSKHWLADGFHRYYAAVAAQKGKLDCEVQQGGLREAILFSCGANGAHGARRSNADKRRAVTRLLQDDEWSQWSNYEIAKRCAVDDTFVLKVRKEVDASLLTNRSEERKYIDKHGNVATMNTANIGGQPRQEGWLIAKSLHEIERHMDMMPAPRDAAADFPPDQRFAFPPSKLDEMAAWLADFAQAYRATFPRAAE